jgi:hypothetical protein
MHHVGNVLLLSSFLFLRCLWNTQPDGSVYGNCVETFTRSPQHLIADSLMVTVRWLFSKNSISLNNLQVCRLTIDQAGNYHVKCNQFYKEHFIFIGTIAYHFEPDGRCMDWITTGNLFPSSDFDMEPRVSKETCGSSFREQMAADPWGDMSFWLRSRKPLDSIYSFCLSAELGILEQRDSVSSYYYTLAWKLTPADSIDHPCAYYNACTGALLYYENGVIIN